MAPNTPMAPVPPSGKDPGADRRISLHSGITLALCAFALVMGAAFLPIPGLQYDEILFLHPFLYDWALFKEQFFGRDIPLMVMSYVGALKTWLYWPLYTWLPPSVWVVRLPMLLVGCFNIWMLYRLGRRLWSPRAGVIAAALAATDPTFLLTHVFDWGPVALQVFLMLGGALAYMRWHDTNRAAWLALSGLCCGLALWNKAIFAWVILGIALAAPLCWPRLLLIWNQFAALKRHGLAFALAALGFAIGAAPFLAYNIGQPGETVTANAKFEQSFPAHKLPVAWSAMDGSVIATAVSISAVWDNSCVLSTSPEWSGAFPVPASAASFPKNTYTGYALTAATVVFVLGWFATGANIGRFLLIVLLVHSAFAIASISGGTGLHHYAPTLPLVFLAIGGAWEMLYRWKLPARTRFHRSWQIALLAIAVALPLQAGVSLYGWLQRTEACGGRHLWTDATQALGEWVRAHPEQRFYATDWGMDPQAIYFSEKKAQMRFLGPLTDEPTTSGPLFEEIERVFGDPATRLVGFEPGLLVIPLYRERLVAMMATHGYGMEEETSVSDRFGRSVYVVWRLKPLPREGGF